MNTADNATEQATVDHFATVILNVVRMNRPWRTEDLKQIADYVKTSSIDLKLQKVILENIVDIIGENNELG